MILEKGFRSQELELDVNENHSSLQVFAFQPGEAFTSRW
jgi:hypothetical protein